MNGCDFCNAFASYSLENSWSYIMIKYRWLILVFHLFLGIALEFFMGGVIHSQGHAAEMGEEVSAHSMTVEEEEEFTQSFANAILERWYLIVGLEHCSFTETAEALGFLSNDGQPIDAETVENYYAVNAREFAMWKNLRQDLFQNIQSLGYYTADQMRRMGRNEVLYLVTGYIHPQIEWGIPVAQQPLKWTVEPHIPDSSLRLALTDFAWVPPHVV